jgi:hypothetical protein
MSGKMNEVHRQFQKLELKREKLMRQILPLTETEYTKQPSPGSWSAIEAANHVYLSEKLSLAYLKKKMAYPDTIPPFHFKSWGGVLLIKLVLGTGYKWKAPESIDMRHQQPVLTPAELSLQWPLQRKELLSFIESHQATFGSHLVYRHPYAGRMTMHQMLIFLNDHFGHHMKQIDRILRK